MAYTGVALAVCPARAARLPTMLLFDIIATSAAPPTQPHWCQYTRQTKPATLGGQLPRHLAHSRRSLSATGAPLHLLPPAHASSTSAHAHVCACVRAPACVCGMSAACVSVCVPRVNCRAPPACCTCTAGGCHPPSACTRACVHTCMRLLRRGHRQGPSIHAHVRASRYMALGRVAGP